MFTTNRVNRAPAARATSLACLCALTAALVSAPSGMARAHDGEVHDTAPAPIRADGHAPIGVMGDHMHKKGEVMVSYRYMRMDMEGTRDGTRDLSTAEILATPNPFAGLPGQPPGLRVIPTRMTMDMHMLGLMWAPTDAATLMAMAHYVEKDMDHEVYNPAGTARIGGFSASTSGIGDVSLSALLRAYRDATHAVHINAGLSLPTGAIDKTGHVLTPMGMPATLRLPYPMQLGSGTVDLLPGITYAGRNGDLSWGAQASATLRLGRNSEGYSLGDKVAGTVWTAWQFAPWISASARLKAETIGALDGRDSRIVAPVQTADPDNHGGDVIEAGLGVNLVAQEGHLRGHRLAIEATAPVHQRLNGPQLKRDWALTLGWQYAF